MTRTMGETTRTNRKVGLIWMVDILGRLFEAWPGRINLRWEPTRDATGAIPSDHSNPELFWRDLWVWMIDEGLVRIERSEHGTFGSHIQQAALTARGFAALNKPVPGADESIGERVSNLAKEVGKGIVVEGGKSLATEAAELAGTFMGAPFKSSAS